MGTYSCGAHRYKPLPPFSWQIPFDVHGGSISARRDYNIASHGGIAATAIFSETRDRDGHVRIDVMARKEDNTENFQQALLGNSTSQGMALVGPMLGAKDVSLRDCQLTLRLVTPPRAQVPMVARGETADAERGRLKTQKATIKAESQRVAATARQVADAKRAADAKGEKATDDAKAAEAARSEELKVVADATLKQADEVRRSALIPALIAGRQEAGKEQYLFVVQLKLIFKLGSV